MTRARSALPTVQSATGAAIAIEPLRNAAHRSALHEIIERMRRALADVHGATAMVVLGRVDAP